MGRKKRDESLIQWQRVKTKKGRGQNFNRYQNNEVDMNPTNHQFSLADPDVLGNWKDEPLTVLEREEIENECQRKVDKLKVFARKTLTEKEHEVFQLLAVNFVSMAEAARRLSKKYNAPVTKSGVQDAWGRVREKLSKFNYA